MKRVLVTTLLALGAAVTAAQAQRDTTARIVGTASSAFNGKQLTGVMIAVPGARRFVVTDSTGRFELAGLPAGPQKVRIAYEGRGTDEYEFELRRDKTKTLAVVLDVEAVDLAPVVVEARYSDDWRNLAGFYARKKMYGGFGHFYTRENLERQRPATLRMLLAGEGIFTRCGPYGCAPARLSLGGLCVVPVSVDGIGFWEEDYDRIPVSDVAAVEVYRSDLVGPSWPGLRPSLPALLPGNLFVGGRPLTAPGSGSCGSIEIWTKR